MDKIREIPIRRSLHRSNLLLGAERELVLLTGLMSFTLIFSSMSVMVMVIGIGIWFAITAILRLMAKFDPVLSKIYIRHIKYRAYYPAKSTPFREG
ncbi:MAG: VirB3 family type IV secretion system protein [Candidatus Margulisbacteria bacterium]|nr:VirB3 family type IV secretion system protein [Candidatus Margulisiibacteriota bacterium]